MGDKFIMTVNLFAQLVLIFILMTAYSSYYASQNWLAIILTGWQPWMTWLNLRDSRNESFSSVKASGLVEKVAQLLIQPSSILPHPLSPPELPIWEPSTFVLSTSCQFKHKCITMTMTCCRLVAVDPTCIYMGVLFRILFLNGGQTDHG